MLFGTAGVPNSSKDRTTVGGVKTIKNLGLDAMEVQFVRGVKMSVEKAKTLGDLAKRIGVVLSVHAPYYINLNAEDVSKLKASVKRLMDSVKIGSNFARNVVFHPGYYLRSTRDRTLRKIMTNLKPILEFIDLNGLDVMLRPETTGKPTQFGDLEETLELCSELEILPCIDFSHIHARTRAFNSYDEFCKILEMVEGVLGANALKDMHIHVSGIEYGLRGEKRHLNLEESDFKYVDLLKALRDFEAKGTVIVESPNLEEDALLLKRTWMELA